MMKTKKIHSIAKSASSPRGTASVALRSTEETNSKPRKTSKFRSLSRKCSSVVWSQAPVKDNASAKAHATGDEPRKRTSRKPSTRDSRKRSSASLRRSGGGKGPTALRTSPQQEASVNSDDNALSSTAQLLESADPTLLVVALKSQLSDDEYFLPEPNEGSDAALWVCETADPLDGPSGEPHRNSLTVKRSTKTVPGIAEESLREHTHRCSSGPLKSQKSFLQGINPKLAPIRKKASNAIPNTVRCNSQHHMERSNSSSLHFGEPYPIQYQRKASCTPLSDLTSENFDPLLFMGPLSDHRKRTLDGVEVSQQFQSPLEAANVDVAVISSVLVDYRQSCSGHVAELKDGSTLSPPRSPRASDVDPLRTLPSMFGTNPSRSSRPSVFLLPMSISPHTTFRCTTNSLPRGSVMWTSMYGTGTDGDNEENLLVLVRHGKDGSASSSVPSGFYQSFFHSMSRLPPLSDSDPNGCNEDADERPAQSHGRVSSLYAPMLSGATVESSYSSDDESNSGKDDSYQTAWSADTSQNFTLERKTTMSAFDWMMIGGKSRPCNEGSITHGGSGSDEDNAENGKDDDGAGCQQRVPHVLKSERESCSEMTHRDYAGSLRSEVVSLSSTSSDDDADAEGNGEGNATPPSQQTDSQHGPACIEILSGSKVGDNEVAVHEERSPPRIAPSPPSRGGNGNCNGNAYQRVAPTVVHCSKPVFPHQYGHPRPNMMLPVDSGGWCAGRGAQAAAHLQHLGCAEARSATLSPPKAYGWYKQLSHFTFPSSGNSCDSYTSPAPVTAPVACGPPQPMLWHNVNLNWVHELLGLDPDADISFVKSPVWENLPG